MRNWCPRGSADWLSFLKGSHLFGLLKPLAAAGREKKQEKVTHEVWDGLKNIWKLVLINFLRGRQMTAKIIIQPKTNLELRGASVASIKVYEKGLHFKRVTVTFLWFKMRCSWKIYIQSIHYSHIIKHPQLENTHTHTHTHTFLPSTV